MDEPGPSVDVGDVRGRSLAACRRGVVVAPPSSDDADTLFALLGRERPTELRRRAEDDTGAEDNAGAGATLEDLFMRMVVYAQLRDQASR